MGFIFNHVDACIHVVHTMCGGAVVALAPQKLELAPGSFEPPDVSAGNQTWFLWQSSVLGQSHLSGPILCVCVCVAWLGVDFFSTLLLEPHAMLGQGRSWAHTDCLNAGHNSPHLNRRRDPWAQGHTAHARTHGCRIHAPSPWLHAGAPPPRLLSVGQNLESKWRWLCCPCDTPGR